MAEVTAENLRTPRRRSARYPSASFLSGNRIVFILKGKACAAVDGAAIMCADPVIALSLRHDRLDSFWFCLMHELAHLALHKGAGLRAFYDDLDVVYVRDEESAADDAASEALIPGDAWATIGYTIS